MFWGQHVKSQIVWGFFMNIIRLTQKEYFNEYMQSDLSVKMSKAHCNEFDKYGKKEAGTGEHLNTFNQINKHKWKAAAPHGRLPQTKHKLKFQAWSSLVFQCRHSSFYSFRSSSVGLETGEWRRCRSLSFTPPASLRSHGSRPRPTHHIPPSPLAGRGVLPRLRSTPPLPPLPGGARQGGRGVPGGKDRRGERKETEGWGVTEKREGREEKKISVRFPDTLPLGPQPAERFTRGAMRWYWTSLVDGPMLLRLLAVGGGSSGRGQPAASPPFPAPPQTWRMAAGFGLQANGATPPLPLRWQPPLLDPGAWQRVFRPTCSSIAPAPPLRAATGGLRYFLLPDLLSTAIPLSSEGSLTACPSFLPGFGTNVMKLIGTGRRRREPANI